MLVALDPGHGGYDPGAVYCEQRESGLNLRQATEARQALADAGLDAVLLRTEDTYLSLDARGRIAANHTADLVVAIHHNAGPGHLRGALAFHWPRCARGRAVAACILDAMPEPLRTRQRLPRAATDLPGPSDDWLQRPRAVLRQYERRGIVAVLLEVGYLTRPEELAAVGEPGVRAAVSAAIVAGCLAAAVAPG